MTETRVIDVTPTDRLPTQIAVHVCGRGPLAVLLHGFPLDHRMWSGVMQTKLRRHRTLCAIDLRGHGQSPWRGDAAHTMEALAEDVAAVVHALGEEQADVCGLSMGGYVALALHASHPSLVRSLVLSNTRPSSDNDAQRSGRAASIEAVAREGRGAIAQAMLPKLTSPVADPLHVAQLRTMIEGTPAETIVADQRGMLLRADRSAELREGDTPTLVIAGDQDALTPLGETMAWTKELLDSEVAVIAETGHMSPLEAPEAWSEVVAAFWREQSSAPR